MRFSKQTKASRRWFHRPGFTLLEVMVAMSILTLALLSLYQSFSSSLFVLTSTQNLWEAMKYSQNELVRWERSVSAPVSIAQGEFDGDHPLAGSRWTREISDVMPLPGIVVRKVALEIKWREQNSDYSYNAEIYIKPN